MSLAQARERAAEARRQLLDGHDPIDAKRASRAAVRLAAARAMTFDQCAEAYIAAHRAGCGTRGTLRRGKTLATYASPVIGPLPVQAIDTALVMKVLEPIWTAEPGPAARLRGRIEAVLDWAKVRGYRTGENPAHWGGHLDHLLPPRRKVAKVEHHAALPPASISAFIADLRQQEGIAARALEFTILTACRTGEVVGARWGEIDRANGVWTISGERMKAGREHRVPLSARALEIPRAPAAGR